jgi:hypothetical protein
MSWPGIVSPPTNPVPILKDYRQVKTIDLPGIDGGTVDIYTAPLVGDLIEIMPSGQEMTNAQSLEMLVRLIKSWNLTDEQGQVLPVTIENLKLLSVEDLVALSSVLEHVRAVVPDEKKSSASATRSTGKATPGA